jgi:hypothetical protein
MNDIGGGWTFESEDYVESEATQDGDYMYFGYWLQSPVGSPSDDPTDYEFDVIQDGSNEFMVDSALSGNTADALTATYEGGAAGRYVTRLLRIKDQLVDPQSPGKHGRFTARAKLEANFGRHTKFDADTTVTPNLPATHHSIGGSITDITDMDSTTDLGFGVITLDRTAIGTGEVTGGTTSANFGETAANTAAMGAGNWGGKFFGPSWTELNTALRAANPGIADADLDLAEVASTLPTGFAGEFNVSSDTGHTRVVGAFATEKQ